MIGNFRLNPHERQPELPEHYSGRETRNSFKLQLYSSNPDPMTADSLTFPFQALVNPDAELPPLFSEQTSPKNGSKAQTQSLAIGSPN